MCSLFQVDVYKRQTRDNEVSESILDVLNRVNESSVIEVVCLFVMLNFKVRTLAVTNFIFSSETDSI